MERKRTKSRYTTPKKGTKRRKIVNLMLRSEGLATKDAEKHDLTQKNINGILEALKYDYGFDLQTIGTNQAKPSTNGAGRRSNIYRIIGRWTWAGKYRSFLRG